MSTPVSASAAAGRVSIDCDPATARDLAVAWSRLCTADKDLAASRPRWFDDVVAMFTAAAEADVRDGWLPEVVSVPLLDRPAGLQLVDECPQSPVPSSFGEGSGGTGKPEDGDGRLPSAAPSSPGAPLTVVTS